MSHHLPAIDALGTCFRIEVFDETTQHELDAAYHSVQAILAAFEHTYSRFKADSVLSILNKTGRLDTPPPEFLTLLHYGRAAYDRTDGIFNIMVGATLVATGYDATYSFTATAHTREIPNPHETLTVSPLRITLTQGQIDLGGLGKGYSIDVIAEHLKQEYGFLYFLINGGGDMYATSNHDDPILIYLEHPLVPNTYVATTTIKDQGFAASSPHKRAWVSGGAAYTHIVNTTQEASKNKPDASFITAASAIEADMFATVALIMPKELFAPLAEREGLGVATYTHLTGTLEGNDRLPVDVT